MGGKALKLFRPEELELLVCGNPKLDFEALEEHSKYEDGYSRDDPVVKHFWEVRRGWNFSTWHSVRLYVARLCLQCSLQASFCLRMFSSRGTDCCKRTI